MYCNSFHCSMPGHSCWASQVLATGAIYAVLGDDEASPVRASGEVVWQNKISETSFETGVMIKGMPNDDKSRFMQFVFDQMTKVVTG